jgi:hypothetical protein
VSGSIYAYVILNNKLEYRLAGLELMRLNTQLAVMAAFVLFL